MAKKFNKTITTPEQIALHAECNRIWEERKAVEKQEKENFLTYCQMEGKYSLGTVADPYAGQGFRGYDYRYPSEEVKAKEFAERQAYYATNVRPLTEKSSELLRQYNAVEEALCIALWGFGIELYHCKQSLKRAEKELAGQIANVEYWKNKIAELEKKA